MFASSKNILTCLAVLAVALAQVFGLQAGYCCPCSGEKSMTRQCEPEACHPGETHQHAVPGSTDQDSGEHCPGSAPVPHPDDHNKIREALLTIGLPPLLSPPAAVFFDLPPALQVPEFNAPPASLPGLDRPGPNRFGSPPMPLLVARTMVRLV